MNTFSGLFKNSFRIFELSQIRLHRLLLVMDNSLLSKKQNEIDEFIKTLYIENNYHFVKENYSNEQIGKYLLYEYAKQVAHCLSLTNQFQKIIDHVIKNEV